MTWYFHPSGTSLDVYDHEGTLVAEGREFTGNWTDYPDEVITVMQEVYDNQPGQGNSRYRQDLLRDAALENIEEGTP